MPLTGPQTRVLVLLAGNRTEESHLAGATAIHMASGSPRKSADLDLFHDREQAVAAAFTADRRVLEQHEYTVQVEMSQPGFIRALVDTPEGERLRIDWAHDSAWRFLPPVKIEKAGHVLHPVDLAVNKVLALAGRDEPRDFIDTVYLHHHVLPLGALCWAASGKDPGLNPRMILELLARKGKLRAEDFERLDLAVSIDAGEWVAVFHRAVQEGMAWVETLPSNEAGCLYRRPGSGLFFAPGPGEAYEVHQGAPGGVLPVFADGKALIDHPAERAQLESFFERKLV